VLPVVIVIIRPYAIYCDYYSDLSKRKHAYNIYVNENRQYEFKKFIMSVRPSATVKVCARISWLTSSSNFENNPTVHTDSLVCLLTFMLTVSVLSESQN